MLLGLSKMISFEGSDTHTIVVSKKHSSYSSFKPVMFISEFGTVPVM